MGIVKAVLASGLVLNEVWQQMESRFWRQRLRMGGRVGCARL